MREHERSLDTLVMRRARAAVVTRRVYRFTMTLLNARLAPAMLAFAMLAGSSMGVHAQGAPTVETARAAIDEDPRDPRAWVALGHAWLVEDDLRAAREAFDRALTLDGALCDAHDGVGLTTYRQEDHGAALSAFQEVVRLCPARFDGHFNVGVMLARLDRPEEAAESFARSLDEAAPEATVAERVDAWKGIASQATILDRHDEAAVAYRAARQLAPSDDALLLLEGEAWLRAGQPAQVRESIAQLDLRTGNPLASSLLARVLMASGENEEAVAVLQRALERTSMDGDSPSRLALAWLLADAAEARGDLETGRAALLNVLKNAPNDAVALYRLGYIYLELGMQEQALEAFLQARDVAPNNAEVRIAIAVAYDMNQNANAALLETERALELLDDVDDADQGQADDRSLLRIHALSIAVRSAYRLERYDKVERLALEWLTEDPEAHEAWIWLGLQAYQQASYQDAIRAFETASTFAPDSRTARTNLASAFLAAERFREAQRVYQSLLLDTPEDAQLLYFYGWSLMGVDQAFSARDAWVSACNLGYRRACEDLTTTF